MRYVVAMLPAGGRDALERREEINFVERERELRYNGLIYLVGITGFSDEWKIHQFTVCPLYSCSGSGYRGGQGGDGDTTPTPIIGVIKEQLVGLGSRVSLDARQKSPTTQQLKKREITQRIPAGESEGVPIPLPCCQYNIFEKKARMIRFISYYGGERWSV